MKLVSNSVSLPFADHTTTLKLWLQLANPGPVTSSTRSELPAIALTGEIEMPGVVCCCIELDPELQPTMPIHRVRTLSKAASFGFMTSPCHCRRRDKRTRNQRLTTPFFSQCSCRATALTSISLEHSGLICYLMREIARKTVMSLETKVLR